MKELICTGTGWYPDSPKADEDKITKAIIRKDGKEIVIDYEYHNKKLHIQLTSDDGIGFKGHYEEHGQRIGNCEFTFYENKKECFLFGGYSSAEDDSGTWCMKLLKPKKEQGKE